MSSRKIIKIKIKKMLNRLKWGGIEVVDWRRVVYNNKIKELLNDFPRTRHLQE